MHKQYGWTEAHERIYSYFLLHYQYIFIAYNFIETFALTNWELESNTDLHLNKSKYNSGEDVNRKSRYDVSNP